MNSLFQIQVNMLLIDLCKISKLTLRFAKFQKDNQNLSGFKDWLELNFLATDSVKKYLKNFNREKYLIILSAIPFHFTLSDGENYKLNLFKEENRFLFRSARTNYIISLTQEILIKETLLIIKNIKGNLLCIKQLLSEPDQLVL